MVYICITLILIVIQIENYVQIKKNCHITSLHSYPATSTWLHYLTYIVTLPPVHSYPTTSTWLHYLTYIVTLSPPHSHTTLLEWSHYLNHHDRTEKRVDCKYLPLSHTKPQKTFLRLCMEQREVLTVHALSVLSCCCIISLHSYLINSPAF